MIMNKNFNYKSYEFNIEVELNSRVEKRINGESFSKIRLSHLGGANFYKNIEVNNKDLLFKINELEQEAKDWVDKREKVIYTDLESQLIKQGFVK